VAGMTNGKKIYKILLFGKLHGKLHGKLIMNKGHIFGFSLEYGETKESE